MGAAASMVTKWHFFPAGDIRNDLYLTLEKGDFERGGKSVQKNIEVTMYVLYADGEVLKVRLAGQFGAESNPGIILVLPRTLSRDPFSQAGLSSVAPWAFSSAFSLLQGDPVMCSDNDFQHHTALPESLPGIRPESFRLHLSPSGSVLRSLLLPYHQAGLLLLLSDPSLFVP